MRTRITKWGNSLAVRLPKKAADRIGFKEGTEVSIDHDGAIFFLRRAPHPLERTRKQDWKQYVIPSNKPKEAVSRDIDSVVYGASR
ncbi:MAG: hypothetical protein A3H42_01895 [Deltaproteobacteria bacterium RIFCSPLOWO2_02_FULL_46_8]|nr:MAG: hypothetical protein A3H42_01895 [Deltaproteobacteria bacterium RIFCSPLOWO2_02_FULL_46_8]